MAIIELKDIKKDFKVVKRDSQKTISSLKSFFHRQYSIINAVNNISLKIEKGEIVGYIGPNGAGKSTTIKLMCGILVPTSGEIFLNGVIPYKQRKANAYNIGVVFGQRSQLWWDLPMGNSLQLLKRMYKISDKDYNERVEKFKDILEIDEFINTPVRSLSLGQKMRAEICASFLHNPSVVFLDEPTIGLDIVAKRRIRDFILEINKQFNTTIILTTHDIADIESVCERVILIDKGQKLFDDKLYQLINMYGKQEKLIISLENTILHPDEIKVQGIEKININNNNIEINYNIEINSCNNMLKYFYNHYDVVNLEIKNTTIEDIVYDIYLHNIEIMN